MNVIKTHLEAQLREEKVQLENVLEAESELHVNRLTRELTTLRRAQQAAEGTGNGMESPELRPGFQALLTGTSAPGPSVDILLESLRQENENLRLRFTDMERDYVRVVRLNEIYREELLEHRRRVSSLIYTSIQELMLTLAGSSGGQPRWPRWRPRTTSNTRSSLLFVQPWPNPFTYVPHTHRPHVIHHCRTDRRPHSTPLIPNTPALSAVASLAANAHLGFGIWTQLTFAIATREPAFTANCRRVREHRAILREWGHRAYNTGVLRLFACHATGPHCGSKRE
jgi:hypothetical protein